MLKTEAVVNIKELLKDEYIFYAHTSKKTDEKDETLQEHIDRCFKHFISIVKTRDLQEIFKNFAEIWFPESKKEYLDLFYELLINTINFHDIGKINPGVSI